MKRLDLVNMRKVGEWLFFEGARIDRDLFEKAKEKDIEIYLNGVLMDSAKSVYDTEKRAKQDFVLENFSK